MDLAGLASLIDNWKAGHNSMLDVVNGIKEWKNGCN